MVILRKTMSRKTGMARARMKECTRQRSTEEQTARMKRQSGRVRMWRMRRFSEPSQPSCRDVRPVCVTGWGVGGVVAVDQILRHASTVCKP